jgi:surface antigen
VNLKLMSIRYPRCVIAVALWLLCKTAMAANPPTTIFPGYGSSPGMAASSLTPTFSWNSASGATGYGLYIRDMTAAGTPLIYPNSIGTTPNPLTGTFFTIPAGYLVNGHTYRWNMTSFVGATEGSTVSTVLYFQTPAAAVAVAATPPPIAIASPPVINGPGSASSPGIMVSSLTPSFGWNSANGATGYGLYIRDMTAPGTPLVYPNSYGTTYPPLAGTSLFLPSGYLVSGHSYRWNMTSFTGSTESSTASSVLYFQTPPAVVSAPTVSSQNSGASAGTVTVLPPTTISPGYANSSGMVTSSLTPVFSWNAASGATGYGLYIRDMTAFGAPLVYPNSSGTTYPPLTGTSFILSANVLVNGHTYRWNMTSFNGSTEILAASSVLYFQTPSVASTPIIAPPSSGSSAGISTANPTQPVVSASPATSTMPPPAEGQPDFSSSYYTTANPFWRNGNAPNASASAKANATGGAFSPLALGNCTWYAYGRMLELGNSATKMSALYGDARQWADEAAAAKILTDDIPEVGAIAQSVLHNHVAVVEGVIGNMVIISESAYIGPNGTGNYLWKKISISSTWFDHYIHVSKTSLSSYTTTTSSSPNNGGIVNGVAKPAIASSQPISTSVQNQTKSVVAPISQAATYAELTLSALPNNEGIVVGGGKYVSGSSRTVTALPNGGCIFENWTEHGKVVSSSASYTFTCNGNRYLVAHFRRNFMNRPFTPNSPPNSQNQFRH